MGDKSTIILKKLLSHIAKIEEYSGACDSFENFSKNSLVIEACVFNLGQMGELVKRLDDSFTSSRPDIPWRGLYGLRNRIIHDYEGVNFSRIWEIIRDDLPDLKLRLDELLTKYENGQGGKSDGEDQGC
ncbi:MAG: DUF86 domain-containing protein [Synergistaceae bacterium]|jgi:uncharacterized protein with HEPN domain|nr:DUF86 domain-containing protein [Synergistaceae bacterium]